jgi:hypothetical protein
VPEGITGDTLWNMTVYRQALFLGDLAWFDVTKLARDKRTLEVSDHLHRISLCVHIIRQLLTMVPAHRHHKLREETARYEARPIENLFAHVPMPDE